MSKGQMLRALVKQRLTAAAEEIFGLFERTIAEYEEELCRSKEENERQREILDAVFKPQLRLHRADVQPFLVSEEEVLPEPQDWRTCLNQEDPPDIKQEVYTSQEEEQLEGPEEAEFTFTPVPAKSEYGEEERPHSSQLHQTDRRKTEAGGEDSGGPEPAKNSDPPDTKDTTEDSCESQSGLNSLKNIEAPVNDEGFHVNNRLFCISEYSKTFCQQVSLKSHMRLLSAEKRFSCSLCSKRFSRKATLSIHMKIHTGEKRHHCSFCPKRFSRSTYLQSHMRIHTGEKPYSCSLCNKCFTQTTHLQLHKRIHTGEKPYTCSICDQSFTWPTQLKRHKCGGDDHHFMANQEEDAGLISVTCGPVESEDGDEEKPQSSQFHQMNS